VKLLIIYANKFAYKTSLKSLESASETTEQNIIENAVVGFIHVEEKNRDSRLLMAGDSERKWWDCPE